MVRESSPAGGSPRPLVPRIELYEDGKQTVMFDGKNPFAWISARKTVTLARAA